MCPLCALYVPHIPSMRPVCPLWPSGQYLGTRGQNRQREPERRRRWMQERNFYVPSMCSPRTLCTPSMHTTKAKERWAARYLGRVTTQSAFT